MAGKYDFIIVGAGIVGLATARRLQLRQPRARILLLDKEAGPARHQTGHNSGVVHAGVYYEPGSLKAQFCREGSGALFAFCHENGIPARRIGKLLVVSDEAEWSRAEALFSRCRENGLRPEWFDADRLRAEEPAIRGLAAIHVPESGITSYPRVCRVLLDAFRAHGGEAVFGARVTAIDESESGIHVGCGSGRREAERLVACAGLMADRLARVQGLEPDFRIVPYRGEYYRLRAALGSLVRHLVYPIPDPSLPFLGVHLTPMIDGVITVGPNAVQGWKREGYGRVNFSLRDTASMLTFPGFWKATARHWRQGLAEFRDALSKRGYLQRVRRYCPGLHADDLRRWPAGIRAQAVMHDGTLYHDFLIRETARSLHVLNAPSPAATSAFPIADHVCDRLLGT